MLCERLELSYIQVQGLEYWACNPQVLGLIPVEVIGGDRK